MALPSLVRTMPPIGSRSILSMLLGPRVVRTMSDTAYIIRWLVCLFVMCALLTLAALMLAVCALRPCSRYAFWFRMYTGALEDILKVI